MTSPELLAHVAACVVVDGVIADVTPDGVRVEPVDGHRHPVVSVWYGDPDDLDQVDAYRAGVLALAASAAHGDGVAVPGR